MRSTGSEPPSGRVSRGPKPPQHTATRSAECAGRRHTRPEPLAVGPHRGDAGAEGELRAQALGSAREAVGHEQRLAHAVRGLVGADRERVGRQARLERADLRVVELLDDRSLRAHGGDRSEDARLAVGLAHGELTKPGSEPVRASMSARNSQP